MTNKEYYLHDTLKKNLDILKKKIRQDWYFIIIISGSNRVRIGKTTLAQQVAYYLDPKFDFSNVTFDPSKVKEVSLTKKRYQVVLYDEARSGLDAKRAMENMQKKLLDFLAMAGQLNQFLIIVLPDYFEMKKEIATNQSICLINCYTPQKNIFQRGLFQFFNIYKKNRLYYWGRKSGGNYWAVAPSFTGNFTNYWILSKKKYANLKAKAIIKLNEEEESDRYKRLKEINANLMNQRNDSYKFIYKESMMSQRQLAEHSGLTQSSIKTIVKSE